MTAAAADSGAQADRQVFGHPRGLVTLFFTEMWERLSYYGMRAILILFMVDQIMNGGLQIDDLTATAIYGIYTAAVYLVALPGGWPKISRPAELSAVISVIISLSINGGRPCGRAAIN